MAWTAVLGSGEDSQGAHTGKKKGEVPSPGHVFAWHKKTLGQLITLKLENDAVKSKKSLIQVETVYISTSLHFLGVILGKKSYLTHISCESTKNLLVFYFIF